MKVPPSRELAAPSDGQQAKSADSKADKMSQKSSNNSNIIDSIFRREIGRHPSSEDFRSRLFKNRLGISRNLYKKDLLNHYGCVNAIEFSEDGNWLVSGEENFIR